MEISRPPIDTVVDVVYTFAIFFMELLIIIMIVKDIYIAPFIHTAQRRFTLHKNIL